MIIMPNFSHFLMNCICPTFLSRHLLKVYKLSTLATPLLWGYLSLCGYYKFVTMCHIWNLLPYPFQRYWPALNHLIWACTCSHYKFVTMCHIWNLLPYPFQRYWPALNHLIWACTCSRCHCNKGRSEQICLAPLNMPTLNTPYLVQVYLGYVWYNLSYPHFCAKICEFLLPWQHGSIWAISDCHL